MSTRYCTSTMLAKRIICSHATTMPKKSPLAHGKIIQLLGMRMLVEAHESLWKENEQACSDGDESCTKNVGMVHSIAQPSDSIHQASN
jgi:hypothetical protein